MNNETIEAGKRVRLYDNGGRSIDRYTAVYMDYPEHLAGAFAARAMDENPFHPAGFGQYTVAVPGKHLGRRITWDDLPPPCRELVRRDLEAGE